MPNQRGFGLGTGMVRLRLLPFWSVCLTRRWVFMKPITTGNGMTSGLCWGPPRRFAALANSPPHPENRNRLPLTARNPLHSHLSKKTKRSRFIGITETYASALLNKNPVKWGECQSCAPACRPAVVWNAEDVAWNAEDAGGPI